MHCCSPSTYGRLSFCFLHLLSLIKASGGKPEEWTQRGKGGEGEMHAWLSDLCDRESECGRKVQILNVISLSQFHCSSHTHQQFLFPWCCSVSKQHFCTFIRPKPAIGPFYRVLSFPLFLLIWAQIWPLNMHKKSGNFAQNAIPTKNVFKRRPQEEEKKYKYD